MPFPRVKDSFIAMELQHQAHHRSFISFKCITFKAVNLIEQWKGVEISAKVPAKGQNRVGLGCYPSW